MSALSFACGVELGLFDVEKVFEMSNCRWKEYNPKIRIFCPIL